MKQIRFIVPMLLALSFAMGTRGDDAATPETPYMVTPVSATESLSGHIGHSEHHAKGKKKSGSELVLHVTEHHGKKANASDSAHGKSIKLIASGDILTQLNAYAEKHAHVRVSGTLSGETMTVTSVKESKHKAK